MFSVAHFDANNKRRMLESGRGFVADDGKSV
jgi:hypothetical protein